MRVFFNKKILFLFSLFCVISLYGLFAFTSEKSIQHNEKQRIHDLTKKINLITKDLNEKQSFLKRLKSEFHDIVRQTSKSVRTDSSPPQKQHVEELPHASVSKHQSISTLNITTIPVIIFAYNRPSVTRCLDLLFKYISNVKAEFPMVVSQDGNHAETTKAIQSYSNKLVHLRHPADNVQIPPKHKRFQGYYKISSHYKWAISEVFNRFSSAKAVIIVEDDLEVSPDFFRYFLATYDLLLSDPTLYCVSAWNDNGKKGLIDERATTLLYRSDFFPGLGWMLKRSTWMELQPNWPASFWDDWIRDPPQRKKRSCIRPEIPRSKTFGRTGVSNGQFYDKHLKFIELNEEDVNWQEFDLSYLKKEEYDKHFVSRVLTLPEISVSQIRSRSFPANEVKFVYTSASSFKSSAKLLGIMEDFKAGVPRTAYHGIVSVFYSGVRVYLTPNQPWNGYDVKWV